MTEVAAKKDRGERGEKREKEGSKSGVWGRVLCDNGRLVGGSHMNTVNKCFSTNRRRERIVFTLVFRPVR